MWREPDKIDKYIAKQRKRKRREIERARARERERERERERDERERREREREREERGERETERERQRWGQFFTEIYHPLLITSKLKASRFLVLTKVSKIGDISLSINHTMDLSFFSIL